MLTLCAFVLGIFLGIMIGALGLVAMCLKDIDDEGKWT